jgi:CBS domain-containing protein
MEQGEWAPPQRDLESRRFRWEREPLTARDIMTRNPASVTPQSSLQQTGQIMKDENCGIVPVVDETHRLLGVLTDRDIVVRAVVEDKTPSQAKVQEYMTEDVEAVTPHEEVREIIELMGKKQIRRIPVVDRDDRLIGIISLADIANRADYDEELQEALIKISARRSFWSRLFS